MNAKPRVTLSFHFCVYTLCSTIFLPEVNTNMRLPPSPDTAPEYFTYKGHLFNYHYTINSINSCGYSMKKVSNGITWSNLSHECKWRSKHVVPWQEDVRLPYDPILISYCSTSLQPWSSLRLENRSLSRTNPLVRRVQFRAVGFPF